MYEMCAFLRFLHQQSKARDGQNSNPIRHSMSTALLVSVSKSSHSSRVRCSIVTASVEMCTRSVNSTVSEWPEAYFFSFFFSTSEPHGTINSAYIQQHGIGSIKQQFLYGV